jgi:lipopolysaccharide export system protein LptC
MMPGRRELALAVLLALVGAGAWWLQRASTPPAPPPVAKERRPDYIVDRVDALVMDERGRPDRRLIASEVRHYADDGSAELTEPRLIVYADDGPPWRARADTGWVNAAGDEILLEENVRIERAATATGPPLLLRSSEMLILPETDYAETARFAELDSGEDWLTAQQGMRVWFGDAMRAKLFGRVRARERFVDGAASAASAAEPAGAAP